MLRLGHKNFSTGSGIRIPLRVAVREQLLSDGANLKHQSGFRTVTDPG